MRKSEALLTIAAMAAMSEQSMFGHKSISFHKRPALTYQYGAYNNNRRGGKKRNCTRKTIANRRRSNKAARRSRQINRC